MSALSESFTQIVIIISVRAVSCLSQKSIWGMRSDFNQKGQIPPTGATSIETTFITVNIRSLANNQNEY